jgi:hypothetical protein
MKKKEVERGAHLPGSLSTPKLKKPGVFPCEWDSYNLCNAFITLKKFLNLHFKVFPKEFSFQVIKIFWKEMLGRLRNF